MKYNIKALAVAVFGLATTISTRADTFFSNANQGSGNTPNWNSAIWTNAANTTASAPSSGNDYVFGDFAGVQTIRSPYAAATQPFNGNSLQLDINGSVRLKNGNSGSPAVGSSYSFGAGGLKLNGGFLDNGDDQYATIGGPVSVLSASSIYAANDGTTPNSSSSGQWNGFRGYKFTGSLSGSGNLTLANAVMYNNSQVTAGNQTTILANGTGANFAFNGSGASYTGNITITSGWLQAGAVDAFGSANITLAGGIAANGVNGPVQFDATTAFSDLGSLTINDVNSTLLLDNNMIFGIVTIDGTTLAPGVYTESTLAGEFSNVTGTSTDTLTVVPEPSSIALAVTGGLGILVLRRRRA